MLNIPFFNRHRKPVPVVTVSPVDAVITAFLDALSAQTEDVDYAAAYDAVTIARDRGYTRPVDIWRIYHNALGWS